MQQYAKSQANTCLLYTSDQNLSQPDLDVKFLTAQMAMSRTSLYNKVKEPVSYTHLISIR